MAQPIEYEPADDEVGQEVSGTDGKIAKILHQGKARPDEGAIHYTMSHTSELLT